MANQAHKRRRNRALRVHSRKTRRPDDPPSTSSMQRELEERWLEVSRRAQAAMSGTLSPDEAPVNVSSIYSFLPEHLSVPAGTPWAGPGSLTEPGVHPFGSLMSEDMVNLILEQEYGTVEKGMEAVKTMYANMDVIGNEPPPGDDTVQRVDIPCIPFYMRFWMGLMDRSRTICFHIMDATTDEPGRASPDLKMFNREAGVGERYRLYPTEHYMNPGVQYPVENYRVHDGDVLEFVVGGERVKTVRLPSRACDGAPVLGYPGPPAQEARPLEVLFTK
ncbi:hypothetical protein BD626DRAFT_471820 [Schizophyllum amplum]|uniref:Uncharacterized protein n=1 Tax=Schizophyllum amplum TaxID=97359 RepID=A0A550CVG0_9AGAR|nr:hypothetical protein BD626DRAFT_471820 [Auriculariopsis ampla]